MTIFLVVLAPSALIFNKYIPFDTFEIFKRSLVNVFADTIFEPKILYNSTDDILTLFDKIEI